MLDLTLERRWPKEDYTVGRLYVGGEFFCNTLEDKDRGLIKTWPLSRIKAAKVPGRTAIPKGTYAVTLKVRSPKFSQWKYRASYGFCDGYLPRLLGVPGFEGVLIHIGNKASQTDGCVLVGVNDKKGMVTKSTATFRKLYAVLKEADDKGESISITIR